ncbi:Imm51 family immunity protein [Kribbella sp. NPDC004138]
MTLHSQILDIDGGHSLTFYCGELPADVAVSAAGHEPNGYFWEGVATVLAPELVHGLELDSEAGMFSAAGQRSDLAQLQTLLEPVLASPDVVREVIARAESEGFEFDD